MKRAAADAAALIRLLISPGSSLDVLLCRFGFFVLSQGSRQAPAFLDSLPAADSIHVSAHHVRRGIFDARDVRMVCKCFQSLRGDTYIVGKTRPTVQKYRIRTGICDGGKVIDLYGSLLQTFDKCKGLIKRFPSNTCDEDPVRCFYLIYGL